MELKISDTITIKTEYNLTKWDLLGIFVALVFVVGLRMLSVGLGMLGIFELPGWLI